MTEQNIAVVRHLAHILEGRKPLTDIKSLLSPNTVTHFDDLAIKTTPQSWQIWVQFLGEQGRVSKARGELIEIVANEDQTITLRGKWLGERNGKQVTSKPGEATYRLKDGLIVDIWTNHTNYTFFFKLMRYRLTLNLVFLYFIIWRRFWRNPVSHPTPKSQANKPG